MSRVWFSTELETVATFWRVARTDGVSLGFTSHDGDLWFDGILHRAAPGMLPSAIRRTADFEADSAEVQGALAHDSLTASDLASGRFDGAAIAVGVVDWQSLERFVLYRGKLGTVSEDGGKFSVALVSRKAELQRDPVPRTSPACRASFAGPGCSLSAVRFEHRATVTDCNTDANSVGVTAPIAAGILAGGRLRWLEGPLAGLTMTIAATDGGRLVLAEPIEREVSGPCRVIVREGCDRTIGTCAARFHNAINFRGEPYLPGNDLITRYPSAP